MTKCIQYSQIEKVFHKNALEIDVLTDDSETAWWHMRNAYNCLIQIPRFPGWLFKVSASTAFSAFPILSAKIGKYFSFSQLPVQGRIQLAE